MAPADLEDIVAGIPADTGAEAVEDEHEGFSGGPSDPSVLTQYANHVACSVWTGELSSHGRKVHSLGKLVLAIEGLVAGTGLSPLIACSEDTGDQGLLSSFVERWHRETSSFHLPVGELTITAGTRLLQHALPWLATCMPSRPCMRTMRFRCWWTY
ncbi:Protein MAIN-LIKE 1 [Glycine max]|nr:Protein MAIN-LIKE 1 [Glycine max]